MKLRQYLQEDNQFKVWVEKNKKELELDYIEYKDNCLIDKAKPISFLDFSEKLFKNIPIKQFELKRKIKIKEDDKSQKMVDTAFKKAHDDINKDSTPVNLKASAKMGITEGKDLKSLQIKVELGNDSMQTSTDAEKAIKEAFKKLHLGSGGPAFVKIYDENGNSVGSLEVK